MRDDRTSDNDTRDDITGFATIGAAWALLMLVGCTAAASDDPIRVLDNAHAATGPEVVWPDDHDMPPSIIWPDDGREILHGRNVLQPDGSIFRVNDQRQRCMPRDCEELF